MRAFIALREGVDYRRRAFAKGLQALGYQTAFGLCDSPKRGDVLVIWNRYGVSDQCARRFEAAGLPVLVAENGYLGKNWLGDYWLALSRNQHNGCGAWPEGGPERWDGFGAELAPWRTGGAEIVVLPQRGVGPAGVAMPPGWTAPGRIRRHPGSRPVHVGLEDDLRNARAVITWGSGAALKALLWGVPVYYALPGWIGAAAATRLRSPLPEPFMGDRLPMFRRLAWAMWRLSEIEDGTAFRALLEA